jgi:hypothetical protein
LLGKQHPHSSLIEQRAQASIATQTRNPGLIPHTDGIIRSELWVNEEIPISFNANCDILCQARVAPVISDINENTCIWMHEVNREFQTEVSVFKKI